MSFLDKLLYGVDLEWKTMGEVADIGTGSSNRKDEDENGQYPFYVRSQKILKSNHYQFDETAILVPGEGGIGDIFHFVKGKYALHQRAYRIKINDTDLEPKFLYFYMRNNFKSYIISKSVGATATSIRKPMLEKFSIPIPPLDIQKEIVRILDSFTGLTAELKTELTARKKQFTYYREQLLSFEDGNVEWKTLGEVCLNISAGGDVPKNCAKGQLSPTEKFPYPIYANATGSKGLYGYTDSYKVENKSVTISARGAKIGYHTVREAKFTAIIRLIVLEPNENLISSKFLNYALEMTPISGTKGGIPQLTVPTIKKLSIPVPSVETQERIVSILDKFETLVTSKNEGVPAEIAMRQKQYEYYRDMLLTFPKNNTAV